MKKILSLLSIICLMFMFSLSSVEAAIRSVADVNISANKLYQLSDKDLLGIINKNELIGYRLDSFNMSSMQYQNYTRTMAESVLSVGSRMELIENSSEISDTEKELQMNMLYTEAEGLLSDVNSKTISYLIEIRRVMPSITYQQYVKRFLEYYNGLQITDYDLKITK